MFRFVTTCRWKSICTALDISFISGCGWMYGSWGRSSSRAWWCESDVCAGMILTEFWRPRWQHLICLLMKHWCCWFKGVCVFRWRVGFSYNNLHPSVNYGTGNVTDTNYDPRMCIHARGAFLNSPIKVEFITQTAAHYASGLVSLLDSKDCGNLYTLLGD